MRQEDAEPKRPEEVETPRDTFFRLRDPLEMKIGYPEKPALSSLIESGIFPLSSLIACAHFSELSAPT